MDAENSRTPVKYQADSKALDAIFESAYAQLAQRYRMDDEGKSKLVTIVLKTYFFELEDRGPVDIEPLVAAAVTAFDGLMSAEN